MNSAMILVIFLLKHVTYPLKTCHSVVQNNVLPNAAFVPIDFNWNSTDQFSFSREIENVLSSIQNRPVFIDYST